MVINAINTSNLQDPYYVKKDDTVSYTGPTNQLNKEAYSSIIQNKYNPTDYSQVDSPLYARTKSPVSTVSYGDVQSQINKAANTGSTAQYQSPQWFSQAAQNNYESMNPIRQNMNTQTNANYNQSAEALKEMLAGQGLNRGGTATNQLMGNEIARNGAIGANNTNVLQQAMNQTIPQAQLGLSERGYLYGQQQDATQNLSSLLGQQQGQQNYADQYNNSLGQQQYQNQMDQLAKQAAENQWAAQFGQQQGSTGLDEQYRQQALQAQILSTLLGYGGTLASATPSAPIPNDYASTLTQYLNALRSGA